MDTYKNLKENTISVFQIKHCKYCKNKDTDLCEIRKNINNEYNCEFEESLYERNHIK